MLESKFQRETLRDLRAIFPGCVILKNDSSLLQGIPDILVLFEDRWAMLEFKQSRTAAHQPNQEYYVNKLGEMSYAAFIYPENKAQVFHEIQLALRPRRQARVSLR